MALMLRVMHDLVRHGQGIRIQKAADPMSVASKGLCDPGKCQQSFAVQCKG